MACMAISHHKGKAGAQVHEDLQAKARSGIIQHLHSACESVQGSESHRRCHPGDADAGHDGQRLHHLYPSHSYIPSSLRCSRACSGPFAADRSAGRCCSLQQHPWQLYHIFDHLVRSPSDDAVAAALLHGDTTHSGALAQRAIIYLSSLWCRVLRVEGSVPHPMLLLHSNREDGPWTPLADTLDCDVQCHHSLLWTSWAQWHAVRDDLLRAT